MRPGKTVETPRRDARSFLGKAEEFLAAARHAAVEGQHDASMLAAVHAAIAANDAACVALLGRRSTDPDHQRAVDLLASAASGEGELGQRTRQLRALLDRKNLVAYEARRATAGESRDALRRAERFVSWAAELVLRARL